MSVILDALRKSDARRRSVQGPALVSDAMRTQPVRRRHRPGLALAGFALVSGAVVFFAIQPESLTRLMSHEAPMSTPSATPDDDLSVPQLPGEPAAVARLTPAEVAGPAVEPARASEVASEPEPESQPESESQPTPASQQARVAEPIEPEPMVAAPIATEPPVAESAEAEPVDYVMFWELPLAVRQDIPPLTINLHMYTADESGRFVLINGQRRRQGEQLADGIEVVEIRSEGAILESQGYRFLLRR